MKIHFAYYNQFKNGIDIAFADNTLLFLSCADVEKGLHTTPNSQRLIDNLAIEEPITYAALASTENYRNGLMLWMRIGVLINFINLLFSNCHPLQFLL